MFIQVDNIMVCWGVEEDCTNNFSLESARTPVSKAADSSHPTCLKPSALQNHLLNTIFTTYYNSTFKSSVSEMLSDSPK